MIEQIDLFHKIVGMVGGILVINGILILSSSRYYSFFDKAYYFESISDEDKEKVKGQRDWQRYGGATIIIIMGISAIAWGLGFDFIL